MVPATRTNLGEGPPPDVARAVLRRQGHCHAPGRAATAKAAAATGKKLTTQLPEGEKRHRKRMAELGAVHHMTPVPHSPTDVLASGPA